MKSPYKTTHNLIPQQLSELKFGLFYEDPKGEFEKFSFPDEIPDSTVHEYYKGTDFVNDDFFCTADMDDDEVIIYMITQTNKGKQVYHYEVDFELEYNIVIRTDFLDLTVEQATKLCPKEVEEIGKVLKVCPISVKDMVKFYECFNYPNWILHHRPK